MKTRTNLLSVMVALGCFTPLAGASAPAAAKPAATALSGQIRADAAAFGGHVAFAAVDLKTGKRVSLHAERRVPSASVIKLPVMVEAFYLMQQGKLRWSQPVRETAFDRVPGSGILRFLSPNLHLTLGDAITLMIELSDNTAANIVIRHTGIAPVNDRMRALGLKNTQLLAFVFHSPHQRTADQKQFGLGFTTASDMVRLLTMIERHRILTPAACEQMLGILRAQQDNEAFPRETADFPGVTWAHKTGALDAVRNDVGIAEGPDGAVVMAGFAYDSPSQEWTAENPALLVLAHLARTALTGFYGVPAVAAAH